MPWEMHVGHISVCLAQPFESYILSGDFTFNLPDPIDLQDFDVVSNRYYLLIKLEDKVVCGNRVVIRQYCSYQDCLASGFGVVWLCRDGDGRGFESNLQLDR